MGNRYFPGTAMGGRLYPEGIGNWGPWDRGRLVYWTEANVDGILKMRTVDRKADTADQLTEMTRATVRPGPAVTIWIREGLEDVAQKLWEHPKAKDQNDIDAQRDI